MNLCQLIEHFLHYYRRKTERWLIKYEQVSPFHARTQTRTVEHGAQPASGLARVHAAPALSDTELAELARATERDLRRAQRQRQQLEHLQEHYEQHQDGPRERELITDAEQWRSVLAKLDSAENAAAAKDVAAELRRQVSQHAAETPTRKRARAAWEQQTDALEERAFPANAEASNAADAAYRARAGLPADRAEWAQMRQRAQAALSDIDRRLEDARREDATERDHIPATVTRIREQVATTCGDLTQLNAERGARQAGPEQPDLYHDRRAQDDRDRGKDKAEHGRDQER